MYAVLVEDNYGPFTIVGNAELILSAMRYATVVLNQPLRVLKVTVSETEKVVDKR